MIKNAIIGLLATALLFTNTMLVGYGILAYLSMSAVAFAVVCAIEDMWEKHMKAIRQLKKFKEDVNREITPQPTKADRVI